MWWLIINRQRLTYEAIHDESAEADRYSCSLDKFGPDDCEKLFGYITKTPNYSNAPMSFEMFKILYRALNRVRQIQGYGVFYNVTSENMAYTAQECALLADYIAPDEEPSNAYEPLSRLVRDTSSYTIIKKQYRQTS